MAGDWRTLNRANWDERVAAHLAPGGYDIGSLASGARRFDAIVEAELPPVPGRRVLHLQCHFGLDSLTLAQRGADVTGLDFSSAAIAAARQLASDTKLPARFIEADMYDAPADLAGGFDMVFTTWGTICWLPDITAWAQVVATALRPGGVLYFADAHPIAYVFDDTAAQAPGGRPGFHMPYFGREPLTYEDATDYANPSARLRNACQMNWLHPLGDILGALRSAGLIVDWLHEHPHLPWRMFASLRQDGDGLWTWPDRPWLPLAMSLRAVKACQAARTPATK